MRLPLDELGQPVDMTACVGAHIDNSAAADTLREIVAFYMRW
jgi:hypothetical protein